VSVCLSHSPAAATCGGFAAERRAGRRYRSTAAAAGRPAAAALRRSTALSGEREQCHVVSRRRKLKTDSLLLEPVALQLTRSLLFAGFACSSKLDFDTEPV